MTTATDFAKQLSRFLSEYLPHERNVSPNTLSAYRDAFVQYIDYMHTKKGVAVERLFLRHLTRQNVVGYLNWILDERNCSPATRNYRLAAIHAFVSFLQYNIIEQSEEWQKILSIKAMRTEKKALNYLSQDGIRLLLHQPDVTTWQGRRHLAMLSLMYDTGARVQEIADLTVDCVRIDSEPYTIRLFGKGRKARVVPMVKEQVNHLRLYMEENHLDNSNMFGTPLFFNNRHEKLTREGVAYVLKTYADMAREVNPRLYRTGSVATASGTARPCTCCNPASTSSISGIYLVMYLYKQRISTHEQTQKQNARPWKKPMWISIPGSSQTVSGNETRTSGSG